MSTACKSPWMVAAVALAKHHQGSALTAHTYHTRRREMGLMAVTHNIMILRPIKLFYKALPTPFMLGRGEVDMLAGAWSG